MTKAGKGKKQHILNCKICNFLPSRLALSLATFIAHLMMIQFDFVPQIKKNVRNANFQLCYLHPM